jgi:hypothetical protein
VICAPNQSGSILHSPWKGTYLKGTFELVKRGDKYLNDKGDYVKSKHYYAMFLDYIKGIMAINMLMYFGDVLSNSDRPGIQIRTLPTSLLNMPIFTTEVNLQISFAWNTFCHN